MKTMNMTAIRTSIDVSRFPCRTELRTFLIGITILVGNTSSLGNQVVFGNTEVLGRNSQQSSPSSASLANQRLSPELASKKAGTELGNQADVKASRDVDVVIYGGTSAAIVAAIQVAKMGNTVVVVSPDKHLGGLTSGGLGWTDSGNRSVVGGLSREFYERVWEYYQAEEAWAWQTKNEFGNRSQGKPGKDGDKNTMWVFEPHVAEQIFEDWVKELGIEVFREEWLDRENGVSIRDGSIQSIKTLSGKVFHGKVFLDTTYEGDLLASAGASFHVGREAQEVYDETWNGIQVGVLHHNHHFKRPVDPFVIPGDPNSGLLPRISAEPPGKKHAGDHRVQAYCFRMCLTRHDANRIPFEKPDGYDPSQYELLARILEARPGEFLMKPDPLPNYKTDTNNNGPFSTDNIGFNYEYPKASYSRRQEIIDEHERYQRGLMYFLANDSRVPEQVRAEFSKWGLAKDEFVDNDNWPHQLYIREARRLVGEYVMTEHDCLDRKETPQSIGMGSYVMDSHNVQRYVTADGIVQNEGDIGVSPPAPYEIAWGAILPKQDECQNLLVPVCVSSSHIAFGSIRMEPVFMVLGQSAATAACLSIQNELTLHELPYSLLQEKLLKDGQVLEFELEPLIGVDELKGIVIDDDKAEFSGHWVRSTSTEPYVGSGYRHDDNQGQGQKKARFQIQIEPGRYELRIHYPAFSNRATNAKVVFQTRLGARQLELDMTKSFLGDSDESIGNFQSLGVFEFDSDFEVTISNLDADGFVVVDAIQLIPQ